MATDGPTPQPCNPNIFKKGTGVCIVDGSSNAVERWVQAVAKKADAQVDWHFSGGRANVLHLGDDDSRQRVLNAIDELESELDGTVLSVDGPALYRQGVENAEDTGPTAILREIDGELVLDDPEAYAMIQAVGKHNCKNSLEMNTERVTHFKQRHAELGKTPDDTVIILLNVDDTNGAQLAEILMPGYDWQPVRDEYDVPFARGLASRDGITKAIGIFDKEAASKLRKMSEVAVVVVDHGVAEVFTA